jgi:acetylornithine/N-succinyldiaminopimelate aminotransferase
MELTKLDQIRAAEAKLLLSTYDRNPILFVGGQGVHIIDENGTKYLDLLSGIGVNALGYGHPVIERAIINQSRALIHTSNLYYHEGQAELALRLTERTGLDRAFFANTGTEAWEGALKPDCCAAKASISAPSFWPLSRAFTAAPTAPCPPPTRRNIASHSAPSFLASSLFASTMLKICAQNSPPKSAPFSSKPFRAKAAFVLSLRNSSPKLARSLAPLLIADEIQSGMGRTGKWCAYQHYGIQPDITTLAKPIAGGLPLGAVLCTEEAARAIHAGMHGTTFGGGPLACAVAIAVIDFMEKENLLAHATEVGDYFQQQLRWLAERHEAIIDVRGKGLMIAAELDSADLAKLTVAEMLKRHILINCTSDTVLRFLPPYILERAHVDTAIAALDEIFTEHAASLSSTQTAAKILGGKTNV